MPEITGVVRYKGAILESKPIEHDGRVIRTDKIVVSADGGLADVFVFISGGAENLKFVVPQESVEIRIVDLQYKPRVIGMLVNQSIKVRNEDKTLHNVHINASNLQTNITMPVPGTAKLKSPTQPEFIKMKCDVYPWMSGWIMAMENPWFAVTDEHGQFKLPPGLPDGITRFFFGMKRSGL